MCSWALNIFTIERGRQTAAPPQCGQDVEARGASPQPAGSSFLPCVDVCSCICGPQAAEASGRPLRRFSHARSQSLEQRDWSGVERSRK